METWFYSSQGRESRANETTEVVLFMEKPLLEFPRLDRVRMVEAIMFIIRVRTTAKDLRTLPKYEFKDEYGVPIIKTYPRTVYYRGSDRHVLAGNRMAPDLTRHPKDAYK